MPLRLYFIRHGETEWSLTSRHTGLTDLVLTTHGEEQARQLQHRLAGVSFTRVFTSPRLRARQTCELSGLGAQAEIEPGLAEWDYGDYEGRRSAEIARERPEWNLFRDGCPGGELPAQISARIDRLIKHLRPLSGSVALFSHGQFGCVFAARWIRLTVVEGQHFALAAASVSILGYSSSHPDVPVISLWNAASQDALSPAT